MCPFIRISMYPSIHLSTYLSGTLKPLESLECTLPWPLKHLIEIPGRCWFVGRQPTTSHTGCSRRLCTQKALHADKWEGSISTASVLWSDLCMDFFAEDTDVTEVDGFVWTNWEKLKNWCWIIYICPVGSGTKARSTPVQTFQIPRWASGCSFPTPGPCVGLVAWLGSCVFHVSWFTK